MVIIDFNAMLGLRDFSNSEVMDDCCLDQKAHLVHLGLKAYVQMNKKGAMSRLQPRIQMSTPPRSPEIESNLNRTSNLTMSGRRDEQSSTEHPSGMQISGAMRRFQPFIRMPTRPTIRPEIDANSNRTSNLIVSGRRDEKPPSEHSDEVVKAFEKIRIDSPESEDQKDAIVNNCVCLRNLCLVFCRYCGYHTKGRTTKNCAVHPNVMFLMDIHQCPKCKSYGLIEHPLPNGS